MAKFQTIPFNITGPTYESRSRPLSSRRPINMYQQYSEFGKDKFVSHSFPGQKLISSIEGSADRGAHYMAELLYRILDQTLYMVKPDGEHVEKGNIEGVNRCIMTDDGENLIIVAEKVYVYSSFTDTLTENTNSNLVNVISAAVLNSQVAYTTAKLTYFSQPGMPTDVSGLDAVGADSSPDDLVRDYPFNQKLYRFGKKTCEIWYNSGVGSPPFERVEGAMFSVGLAAKHSLTNTDNFLYWLGDDYSIYRTSGSQEEKISNDGLSNTIERMSKVNDAIGNSFSIQGQDFYMITFPSAGRTFVFNESLGAAGVFELASTNLNTAYSGTTIIPAYGKNIVISNGDVLELSIDEYTQNTDTMIRQLVTQTIDSESLGMAKGLRLKMSSVKIIMEQGVGLMTGQGVNPRIMIEPSFDGGRSWVGESWVEIGRLGQNTLQVEWDNMATFYEMTLRITLSDPVPLSIYSGTIDIKQAGF